MRDLDTDSVGLLAELSIMLRSRRLPPQLTIAAENDVNQSTVSRAKNGAFKSVTPTLEKLHAYARSRVGNLLEVEGANIEVRRREIEAKAIEDARTPHKADEKERALSRQEALRGLEAYLADGFDPALIVEQLRVLRKAQHRSTASG
jgi:hypothetical protein|tara:strand:+ start:9353 stop:9793 length:441 start_codon:yes stop_codon:yes gene_type:complete